MTASKGLFTSLGLKCSFAFWIFWKKLKLCCSCVVPWPLSRGSWDGGSAALSYGTQSTTRTGTTTRPHMLLKCFCFKTYKPPPNTPTKVWRAACSRAIRRTGFFLSLLMLPGGAGEAVKPLLQTLKKKKPGLDLFRLVLKRSNSATAEPTDYEVII